MRVRSSWVQSVLWVLSLLLLAFWIYSALRPRTYPSEASAYFSTEFLDRSASRAKLAYINSGLASLASFGALYVVSRLSGGGQVLAGMFRGSVTPGKAALHGLLLGALAAVVFSLVGLPFRLYGFHLDRSYGLTRMDFWLYLWDWAKGMFLGIVQYSLTGAFAAWALVRFPRTWHLILSASFLVASLCVSALYPVLIAPMFDKFHPLPDGPVLSDVRELAESAGMRVDNVLVMEASAKTARANAYFAGVGRTKQVVLYDTLLDSNSREGIRLVVAHELGHWSSGHVVKSILLSSLGVLGALLLFRFTVAGSVEGHLSLERFLVALFVFSTLASFVFNPASCYVSRVFEVQADAYSLSLTGGNDAFIASQVSLAATNLSDIQPPPFIQWFGGTHPTTLERITSASR